MMTRRSFLQSSTLAVAGFGSAPLWLARAAAAQGGSKRKILVVIFQRGAVDSLNMLVPFSEKRYYEMRPTLAIPMPGKPNGAIDLDGRFGLHPQMQPLKALWDKQQLAIVAATGSPDSSRSHFDAQAFMESGTAGVKRDDGWLNRALDADGMTTSPIRAISTGKQLALTLRGGRAAVTIDNIQQFQIEGPSQARTLEAMYGSSGDALFASAGKNMFAAMKPFAELHRTPYTPAPGARYAQGGPLGQNLQQIARLIKSNLGVEAAFAEAGGWDHHVNEATAMQQSAFTFGEALAAFFIDMGDRMEDIVLVTMSEFGRTAEEHGTGTDHGHGSMMMVLGGPVRGGHIYGTWPGLEKEQLFEKRDLAVTTDFRDVLSELIAGHFRQTPAADVFPGYQPAPPLELLRS